MKKMLGLLALALALACLQGCSAKQENTAGGPASVAGAAAKQARGKYIAYTHNLTIDADEAKVSLLLDRLVAACEADRDNGCVLLSSNIQSGRSHFGKLQMRAKPAGIAKLAALAVAGGELASRETQAEDLAGPIVESEKRLDMLRSYRQKLEAYEQQRGIDPATLMKVSRELASVQSELEQATGDKAKLMERIDTDLLNITVQSLYRRSFNAPIVGALKEFSDNLASGIASAIVGIAYILPWSLVLLVFWLLSRKLWRKLRKVS